MLDADVLDRIYYHNSLRAWLIALAVMAGVVLGLAILRRLLLGRLERLAKRTRTEADDVIVDLVRRTSVPFRVFMALTLGSLVLTFPAGVRAGQIVRTIAVLALLYQVALWGNGLIGYFTRRYLARHAAEGSSATTITALSYGARLLLYGMLFLLALSNLGIDITALVAGLGIGGIAVALAVQNILGDLFGALSIVLDKPFVVGDFIIVDQYMGTVEHIGLKTTRLRALGGEQIVMSNGELLKSRIRNWARLKERRVVLAFGIPLSTPTDVVERLPVMVRQAIESRDLVRFDRAHFTGFNASAFNFEAVYWILTPDYAAFMDRQQAVGLDVLRSLEREGIKLAPAPQTVVLRRPKEDQT